MKFKFYLQIYLLLQLSFFAYSQVPGWDHPLTIPQKKNVNYPQWIDTGDKRGLIFINTASNRSEICWQELSSNRQLVGGIKTLFSASNQIIFPLSCGVFGKNILCILNDDKAHMIMLRSSDSGTTWDSSRLFPDKEDIFVPTLTFDQAGTAHIFMHMEYHGKFTLYHTQSVNNGINWSPPRAILKDLETLNEPKHRGDFFPTVVCQDESIYVVLQNRFGGGDDIINDELYFLNSPDRGATWDAPRRLTVNKVDDIRPKLILLPPTSKQSNSKGDLLLFWEKNVSNTWGAFSRKAKLLQNGEAAWEDEKRVVFSGNNVHAPMPYLASPTNIYLFWYEFRKKNDQIIFKNINPFKDTFSDEVQLSFDQRDNKKPCVVISRNELLVAWQSEDKKTSSSYVIIRVPDRSVLPPDLYSSTHENGIPSRENIVRFAVKPMPDPSGIKGFATLFDQNLTSEPDIINSEGSNFSASIKLLSDGTFYFHIRAVDNADNWSPTVHFKVIKDSIGPDIISIDSPDFIDGKGSFKSSGTFTINARDKGTVRGYSYIVGLQEKIPLARINLTTNSFELSGLSIGDHFLSAMAIDNAGNWGKSGVFHIVVKGDDTKPSTPDISCFTIPDLAITSNNSFEWDWKSRDMFGIRGYSWVLTKNSNEIVPEKINLKTNYLKLTKIKIGNWMLKIKAVDPSGNWSEAGIFHFTIQRDEEGPVIKDLHISESILNINKQTNMNIISNLSFTWSATDMNGIKRYEYALLHQNDKIKTNFLFIYTNFINFTNLNRDNYLFLVKAVDNKENDSSLVSMKLPFIIKKEKVEKSGDFIYKVKFRDTLTSIIRKTLLTTEKNNKNFWEDIAWYNKIGDVDMIRIDQILRFPAIIIEENKDKDYLAALYLGDPGRSDDIIFIGKDTNRIILRDKYFLRHGKLRPKDPILSK